jgi:hypothetical protein
MLMCVCVVRPGVSVRAFITACVVRQARVPVCVFITAVPIMKLFAWGEGDSGGHVCVYYCSTT